MKRKMQIASFTEKLKQLFLTCFTFTYNIWRAFIGPMDACIYPISCSDYAAYQLQEKPWYKAFPLITLRVLSCNPVTAIILRIYYKIAWRKKN